MAGACCLLALAFVLGDGHAQKSVGARMGAALAYSVGFGGTFFDAGSQAAGSGAGSAAVPAAANATRTALAGLSLRRPVALSRHAPLLCSGPGWVRPSAYLVDRSGLSRASSSEPCESWKSAPWGVCSVPQRWVQCCSGKGTRRVMKHSGGLWRLLCRSPSR